MKEQLRIYVKRVKDIHEKVKGSEAATKNALIGPLFTLLGYDLADPQECIPEFKADHGKGVKAATPVDWAFRINGDLAFFVEAKAAGAHIAKYDRQLGMYFAQAPGVKLGILTNGTQWRFFSDLVHLNLMDTEPFFTWDILNHDLAPALGLLTILQKSQFTPQGIKTFAKRKHYQEPLDPSTDPKTLTTQDRLMAYLQSKQAEHGMTPLVLKKVKFLNPEGIKCGVFFMVSGGGERDKKMRPKLQAILPLGTVIKVKWVSKEDMDKAQGQFPARTTATAGQQTQDAHNKGKEKGLRLPQVRVLKALADAKGPLTLIQLTDKAGYNARSGTASRALYGAKAPSSGLAQTGLLKVGYARGEKMKAKGGGRAVKHFSITDTGKKALE